MKIVVICLAMLLFGTLEVDSLQCYVCASSSSSDDCTSQQIQYTCAAGMSKCGVVGVSHEVGGQSVKVFAKGCMTEDVCEGHGCNQEGIECDIKCCSEDLCNNDEGDDDNNSEGDGSSVAELSCLKCASYSSMGDCIENQTQQQCSPKENRCGVMTAHKGDTSYFRKDCISEELCSSLCKNGSVEGQPEIECELHCCEGDFCNNESIDVK